MVAYFWHSLGLSSIVDLSSEFEGGMYTLFGQDWVDIKEKVHNNKLKYDTVKIKAKHAMISTYISGLSTWNMSSKS